MENLPGRRTPRKITAEVEAAIKEAYNHNDELTSTELKHFLMVW